MRSKARKWGNSLGVLLPKSIADELSIVDGTQLEIDCDGDQITIKKVKKIAIPPQIFSAKKVIVSKPNNQDNH